MKNPMPRRCGAVAAILALTLGLAACSGDDGKEEKKSSEESAQEKTSEGSDLPSANPELPKVKPNKPAKVKAVSLSTCKTTDDGVTASGTAKAVDGKTTKFKITIFFTTEEATVLDFARTRVVAEPDQPAEWSVEKQFDTGGLELRCVVRGV